MVQANKGIWWYAIDAGLPALQLLTLYDLFREYTDREQWLKVPPLQRGLSKRLRLAAQAGPIPGL